MEIGNPKKTVIINPLRLPIGKPEPMKEPTAVPQPVREPLKVPVLR